MRGAKKMGKVLGVMDELAQLDRFEKTLESKM